MAKSSTLIAVGQIWVIRAPGARVRVRRVLAVLDGRVCYSDGGRSPRWCQPRAFRLWIRRYRAVATRTRRKRSLQLRQGTGRR